MSVRQQRPAQSGRKVARWCTAVVVGSAGAGGLLIAGLAPVASAKVGEQVVPPPAMVQDLTPGSASTDVAEIEAWNDSVVFTVDSGDEHQLWQTENGEAPQRLLSSSVVGKHLGEVAVEGDRLFFAAGDNGSPSANELLWVTDGTDVGTEWILDAPDGVSLRGLSAASGTLFFAYRQDNVDDVWATDGTAAGTALIIEDRTPKGAVPFGDRTVLSAVSDEVDEHDLYLTDGTAEGTDQLTDARSYEPPVHAVAGETLFFQGNRHGDVLMKTVGTTDDATIVKRFAKDDSMGNLHAVGNSVVFSTLTTGKPPTTTNWWRSDGTARGTTKIASIKNTKSTPSLSVVMGGRVYMAQETNGITQLWSTDGTRKGTRQVSAFPKPSTGVVTGMYGEMVAAGDRVWFLAKNKANGRELWSSDGTRAGTKLAVDIVPGKASSLANDLTSAGSVLYFTADDGTHGRELWRSVEPVAGALMKAAAKQKQPKKVTKRVKLVAKFKASDSASVTIKGEVKVTGRKSFKIKKKILALEPGVTRKATLRLAKGNKPVLKAIKKWRQGKSKPVWATVSATYRGADGAKSIRRLKIKLT